jgi:3-deoxy-7-phosphoheptulonate synthase
MSSTVSASSTERPLQDVNIAGTSPLISPAELKQLLPATPSVEQQRYCGQEIPSAIFSRGVTIASSPSSDHAPFTTPTWRLNMPAVSKPSPMKSATCCFVVMRVYFEKPRTTVGWKGLINDPHLNDTFDISAGLHKARQILCQINEAGLPAATEMLEPITPQYIADLITLASIGARTTESPTHRQMASGLSMPVGFKNSTEGSLEVAINAMKAAREHRIAFWASTTTAAPALSPLAAMPTVT